MQEEPHTETNPLIKEVAGHLFTFEEKIFGMSLTQLLTDLGVFTGSFAFTGSLPIIARLIICALITLCAVVFVHGKILRAVTRLLALLAHAVKNTADQNNLASDQEQSRPDTQRRKTSPFRSSKLATYRHPSTRHWQQDPPTEKRGDCTILDGLRNRGEKHPFASRKRTDARFSPLRRIPEWVGVPSSIYLHLRAD